MTQFAWLGEIAWKGSVILAASFLAAAWLRRSSAAARHFLWTVALGALLLLPVAISVAPQWKVKPPRRTAATAARPASVDRTVLTVNPNPVKPSRSPWLLLWAMGCTLAAVRFAIGAARTRWIVRRAKPADYAQGPAEELRSAFGMRRRVTVLEAAGTPVPLACGFLRPAIVLPGGAAAWPEGCLRTVLRHELAHIRRYDLGAQALGQAACCVYWFHPLAWIAARRLRQERERACDDAVLACGTAVHEYAADLVDLARGLVARRRGWVNAPAMAEACDLESRIRALFDPGCSRRPLRPRTAAVICTAMLALLLPMASLTVHAQAARGALAGVVQDPSGGRVPHCRVVAKNQDGTNQEIANTDAAGEYRFGAIPPGNYVLEFGSPGFALTKRNVVVASGQAARLDATLELGAVSEVITISGRKPPTVTPPLTGTPQRIRVGGNVKPVRLLQQTRPEYPADLQQLGIEGTVAIRAVISKEGGVLSPNVVNTDVHPRLAQLALDAVKQWRYQPSLLNGQPVETITTLTIDFTLAATHIVPKR